MSTSDEPRTRPIRPRPTTIWIEGDAPSPATSTYRGADSASFTIVRRWFALRDLVMVAFCVFWDGWIVNWYAHGPMPWEAILFPLIHVGAGVFITYVTLAGLLNRTRITVEGGLLTVRHGPLPWRAPRPIDVTRIRQLYCEQIVSSGKGRSVSYTVCAVIDGDERVQLLKSLQDRAEALYIEQALEERLGIEDGPVAGEYVG
jgi:hypothetical protein